MNTVRLPARAITATLVVAASTLVWVASDAAADDLDAAVSSDQKAVVLSLREAERAAEANRAIAPDLREFDYERSPYCREVAGIWVKGFADGTCPSGADLAGAAVQCQDGDTIVMPMWMRQRATPTSPWGPWDDIDPGGCGVDLLPVMTEEDLRRLPIPAPVLTVQPSRTWVLVNIETIVYTDPTPLTLRTDLLGHGVDVELTPTTWTYDFGDGHHLTTDQPGHPHPEHDVYHRYENTTTATTITLTAHWTGRYRIDGSPAWRTIPGHAETTTTSHQFSVEERTSRLVTAPCTAVPTPPDC